MISVSKIGGATVRVVTVASFTACASKLDLHASQAFASAKAVSTTIKRRLRRHVKHRNGIWLRPSGRVAIVKRITVVRTIASVMGRV